jgi:hypothetical protein
MNVLSRRAVVAAALALAPAASAQLSNPLVVTREGQFAAASSAPFNDFGASLALDGEHALVGSPGLASPAGSQVGAAHLFERTASGWTEVAELRASDGAANDRFGVSVALDGDTAVVGAFTADATAPDSGALYVFERVGGTWTQTQKLVGIGADVGEGLGWSLALQGDTLVAGAVDDHHSGGNYNGGAAYFFERTPTGWVQRQRVVAGDGEAFDYFGQCVALDGTTLVVGAWSDNHSYGANGGSAYVFRRVGASFVLSQKLIPADNGSNDRFGWDVDLRAGELAVGAIGDTINGGYEAGSVYVFADSPTGFVQRQKLVATVPHQAALFGSSVALHGDGASNSALLVGSMQAHSPAGQYSGNAFLFERSASAFTPTLSVRSTALEQGANFGAEIEWEGELALVAAPGDDSRVLGMNTGATFAYRIEPEIERYCAAKPNGLGCMPSIQWSGSPSVSSSAPFTIGATNVLNRRTGLLMYGYAPNAAPFQGGTLCIAAPLRRTTTQDSGGSANGDDCTGTYTFDFGAWLRSGLDPELSPGVDVFTQIWSRDPLSSPAIGLTDAVRLRVRP